jgi:FixJ family two-component response regulator
VDDREELEVVRRAIERIYEERGRGIASSGQQAEYERLVRREAELLEQLGMPERWRAGWPDDSDAGPDQAH